MKKVMGVIFDVDGILVDTEKVHFSAFKSILKKYKFNLNHDGYKKWFSGKSIRGGVLSLLKEVKLPIDIDAFAKEKIEATIESFYPELKFYEDTLEFIKKIEKGEITLKDIGFIGADPILALSTGLEKRLLDIVLAQGNLQATFTVFVTAERYRYSKPNPDCFLTALSKMGLLPHQVIGIEDSPSGISALNRAKIFSIGVTTTHTEEELKEADLIVDSLMSLI